MIQTYPLLEKAPDHSSPEFIDFLRDNNRVIFENESMIIIENCKYHTPEKPWYTCFAKTEDYQNLVRYLYNEYPDWEWRKKSADKQTIKRFHIHLYK